MTPLSLSAIEYRLTLSSSALVIIMPEVPNVSLNRSALVSRWTVPETAVVVALSTPLMNDFMLEPLHLTLG